MLTRHFLPGPPREWARRRLRGAGLDVVPFPRVQTLARRGVTVLSDVGAREGLDVEDLRRLGDAGRIVSFAPRTDVSACLGQRAHRDPQWEAVQLAPGCEATTSVIHLPSGEDVAYRRERDLLRAAPGLDIHVCERSNDGPAAQAGAHRPRRGPGLHAVPAPARPNGVLATRPND